jgi:hypothetical protein
MRRMELGAEPGLLDRLWSRYLVKVVGSENVTIPDLALVQAINAITRRFQNMRGAEGRDPLAQLEIDPLRLLNNLPWAYTQDEVTG